MLLNNGVKLYVRRFKPVSNALRVNGLLLNALTYERRDNQKAFGQYVSFPQGFTDAARAFVPSVKLTPNIRAVLIGEGSVSAGAYGIGTLQATISGEGTLSPDAQMGATLEATVIGESSVTADLFGVGSLSATLDAGARPSAFDIAQEVWQAGSSGYPTGSMGSKLDLAGTSKEEIASAVLSAAENTPIRANVAKINDVTVAGTGQEGDTWGPA